MIFNAKRPWLRHVNGAFSVDGRLMVEHKDSLNLLVTTPGKYCTANLGKLFNIAHAIRPRAGTKDRKPSGFGGHSIHRLAKGARRPPPVAKAHIYPKELFPIVAPTPNGDVVRTLSAPH